MVKKRLWILVLVAVVLVAAWLVFDSTFVLLNFQVVRRDAESVTLSGPGLPWTVALKKLKGPSSLDVRQIPITPEQHGQLKALFPDAALYYTLSVGKQTVDMDAETLTLPAENAGMLPEVLPCLPKLKQLTLSGGDADVSLVAELMADYPQVRFDARLDVLGKQADSMAQVLDLTGIQVDTQALEQRLKCMPQLQRLVVPECRDYDWLLSLGETYPELEVYYKLTVCGVETDVDAQELTLSNATISELSEALPHLKALQKLHLTGTVPEGESMLMLMQAYPQVDFLWDLTVCGVAANTGDKELILSNIPMADTAEVEAKLPFFADLERVEMCYCGIPSAQMDALAQKFPQTRFVWAVRVGQGYLRTDAEAFIPFKLGHDIDNPLYDQDCTELKYCTDLVCLDLGHMRMLDISFLEYMPKMQYLILGDTPVRDFTPIKGLTEMIYLEIFNCKFTDHSLLLGMTKLEDLNIGFTPAYDVETLKQLTWLKRLWLPAVPISAATYQGLVAALPNTQVVKYVEHSTAGNWRDNDNYRAMRDLLGMFYME